MKYLILRKVVVLAQKQGALMQHKGNSMFTVLALNSVDIDNGETTDLLVTLDVLGIRVGLGIRSKK